jgi:AbrB family looped-hinge helix DNA binding protein
MHEKKLFGTATVGTKGQIVIPADAREQMGIKQGDRLYVIGSAEGGALALLKEDQIEQFIEKLNLHLESLKELKESKDKA